MSHTLTKAERLYLRDEINRLFSEGRGFVSYPFRVLYVIRPRLEGEPSAAMMVSVAKRRFKRAVKRNRVKRLVREAYRLNKQVLATPEIIAAGNRVNVVFMMIANDLPDFATVERAMVKALYRIASDSRLYVEAKIECAD